MMPSTQKSKSGRRENGGDRAERKNRKEKGERIEKREKGEKRSKKDKVVAEPPVATVHEPRPEKANSKLDNNETEGTPSNSAVGNPETNKVLNVDESDLDPTDFDARIKRCRQRIKEGVAVKFFRIRLEGLRAAKKERMQMISSEPKGLDWDVITRLKSLRRIENYLHEEGDTFEELPNVRAISAAYRSRLLRWYPDDRVTYWSKGRPLGPPVPFNWNEYMKLSTENEGHKGFWVEGNQAPRPKPMSLFVNRIVPRCNTPVGDCNDHRNEFRAVVRLPRILGQAPPRAYEFTFMDDSGASHMLMYKDDLFLLNGTPADLQYDYPWQFMHGFEEFIMANDETFTTLISTVEVQLFQGNANEPGWEVMLLDWTAIQCAFNLNKTSESPSGGKRTRLGGPFLRQMLYTATAPDGNDNLYLSTHKEGLMDDAMLPADTSSPGARSPDWFMPSRASSQKMPYSRYGPEPTPFTASEPVPVDWDDPGAIPMATVPPALPEYEPNPAPPYTPTPPYESIFPPPPPGQ